MYEIMTIVIIGIVAILFLLFIYIAGVHAGRKKQADEDLRIFDTDSIIQYANKYGKGQQYRDGMMHMAAELQDRMLTLRIRYQ